MTDRSSWREGSGRGRLARRSVVLVGALGLLATACSSASGSATSGTSATSTTVPSARPVASGSVTAVSGSSMSVASQFSGTATLQLTSSTTYSQTVSATAQDVTVGGCVAVTGTPPTNGSAAGPVAARSVVISGAGSPCPFTGSTGFGGRGNGRFGGGGGFGGGGFGGGGFSLASTSGKVTAVSGSAVTLVGTGRIVGSVGHRAWAAPPSRHRWRSRPRRRPPTPRSSRLRTLRLCWAGASTCSVPRHRAAR